MAQCANVYGDSAVTIMGQFLGNNRGLGCHATAPFSPQPPPPAAAASLPPNFSEYARHSEGDALRCPRGAGRVAGSHYGTTTLLWLTSGVYLARRPSPRDQHDADV